MGLNSMKVYIQCPNCLSIDISYDCHENDSSERSEYFSTLGQYGKLYGLSTSEPVITSDHVFFPSGLKKVKLGYGVERIDDRAFQNCCVLRDLALPDSVTHIGRRAFSGCSRLAKIYLPERLQEIGERCFENCTALTQVYIPDHTVIGKNAFAGCTALETIELPGHMKTITPQELGLHAGVRIIWREPPQPDAPAPRSCRDA